MYKSLQNNNYSYKFLSTIQADPIKTTLTTNTDLLSPSPLENEASSISRHSTTDNKITTTKTLTFNEIFNI